MARFVAISTTLAVALLTTLYAQQPAPARKGGAAPATPPPLVDIRPIAAPKHPLPSEDKSRGVTRFSFLVYGDTRGASAADGNVPQPAHVRVVETMLATVKARAKTPFPVRFVLQTGDAVLNGTRGDWWNNSYVPEVERMTVGADLPYFLTAGNHDVAISIGGQLARSFGLSNMLAAFSNLIPGEGSPRRLDGYPTYAFGYGNLFLIAFDTNIASDPLQLAWVTYQLEHLDRTRFPHVAALIHHPPYSSGPHGATVIERDTAALRSLYMPLFRRHHVRFIASGHEHFFEAWAERYVDGGSEYRMDTIVTGGGGAPVYSYRGEPDLTSYVAAAPGQNVRVDHLAKPAATIAENPNHFVIVDVDGDKLAIEVVASENRPFAPFNGRSRLELTAPGQ
jgi:3',5'-cyclic AMP phosphodiesterase CpdA